MTVADRRVRTPALVLALCVAQALGGCFGNGSEAGGPAGRLSGDDGEGGSVFVVGLVVDEEFVPVADAWIVTDVEGVEATTDAAGGFELGPLAPGDHTLTVEKRGYATQTVPLTVGDAAPPDLTITLVAVAADVPYHETQQHVTFVICASRNLIGGVPCTKLVDYVLGTNVSSSEKFAFTFQVPNPGLVDVFVEMDWSPQSMGKEMLFFIQTPPNQPLTAATTKYFAMDGPRPLRGWVVAGVANLEDGGVFDAEPNRVLYEGLTVWSSDNSTVPFTSLYLNHRTETWITYFYNRAGPRTFSALPEG